MLIEASYLVVLATSFEGSQVALPLLYWMLECNGCGRRRVVRDKYLVFTGNTAPDVSPGDGYSGPPLPERYNCLNGCSQGMRVVGSLFDPKDTKMWMFEPHKPVNMDQQQINEWLQLIRDAGRE